MFLDLPKQVPKSPARCPDGDFQSVGKPYSLKGYPAKIAYLLDSQVTCTMSENLTVTASEVSENLTVVTPPAVPAVAVPTVRDSSGAILSKRDALALPANACLSRRAIEKAIIAEWRACSKESASVVSSLAHDMATAGGAVVIGKASKTGNRTIRLISAPKERKESQKAKIARLETELAILRGEA